MKPELPRPVIKSELPSISYRSNVEHVTGEQDKKIGVESTNRSYEQMSESGADVSDVSITTSLPVPVFNDQDDDKVTTIGTTPSVAGDDDLIEKEWVDKAKKIVSETRDDPHKCEDSISKLQNDYLRKRYGRELGDSK